MDLGCRLAGGTLLALSRGGVWFRPGARESLASPDLQAKVMTLAQGDEGYQGGI